MPVPAPAFSSTPTVPLHRVRFFDHTPSPITALAFSPTPLPAPSDPAAKGKAKQLSHETAGELGVLVLARDNGEVEIWEWVGPEETSMGNWVMEKILPPTLTHPGVSLMALVLRDPINFHQKSYRFPKLADLRLYTSGSDSGDLVERCLVTGRILQTYSIPAPPLWAMAVSPTHSILALATTSPSLHFLSLTPTGLEPPPAHLLRCEPVPSRTRTVSIGWAPPRLVLDGPEPAWQDTYLVTGNSDSSLRKWQLPSSDPNAPGSGRVTISGRSVVEKIKVQKKGTKGTIVWGVAVLPDNTIVTSDSLGSVIFWDGASMAQKQSFKAHRADGMVLVPGSQGKTVFTGGPDQRVCQFTLVNGSWTITSTKRLHSHDIRALAVFPAYTPAPPGSISMNSEYAPILASGGWDMNVILTPCAPPEVLGSKLRNPLGRNKGHAKTIFEEAYTRRLSYLGGGRGTGRISISAGSRLVLGRKDRSVGIWRLFEEEQGWEKVLEMDLKLRTTLVASAISDDGRWLAVSDLYETKLFLLNTSPSGTLIPRRVKTFVSTLLSSTETTPNLPLDTDGTGSSVLVFTPDSSRLLMGLAISGQVLVLGLQAGEEFGVEVAACFSRSEAAAAGRVIIPQKKGKGKRAKSDMGPPEVPNGNAGGSDDEMEVDEEVKKEDLAKVACMAVSSDGQWLAVSDLGGKVSIYNMDTLRPHSVLPTLPHSPLALLFPPSHPSLLTLVLPTQTISFYHVDNRRILGTTPQLITLNRALRDQFLPIQSASFEPSRSSPKAAKIVLWSSDWVCTARLDLDIIGRVKTLDGVNGAGSLQKTLRKKRAREAREQLERTSASSPSVASASDVGPGTPIGDGPSQGSPLSRQVSSEPGKGPVSSSEDPEFFKFTHDRFRAVAGIEWVGEGEMVVVERPMGDFVGELPAMFWTGGFGRN